MKFIKKDRIFMAYHKPTATTQEVVTWKTIKLFSRDSNGKFTLYSSYYNVTHVKDDKIVTSYYPNIHELESIWNLYARIKKLTVL